MDQRLERIEKKIDKVLDRVGEHRERITRVETNQKGFITIFTLLLTALTTYVANVLHLR